MSRSELVFEDAGELLGEMSDWRNAIALPAKIALPPGLYQYKLRAGRAWQLDPRNPRTRSAGGQRNSVAGIDAAPEPYLFAAAAPWVVELERGGLRVLVGVRKGHEPPPPWSLAWSEDGVHFASTTLVPAFEEDEHRFFTTTLPASAPTTRLALGGWSGTFARRSAVERVPAWWKRASLYGIAVDRFRPLVDDRGPHAGGPLDGIRRSLDALADLGVDVLELTPVHVGAGLQRDDLVDPLCVDPALGGEEAYGALVSAAHARGMRIVQDVSFAHVGRAFAAYEDLALDAVAFWATRGASGIRLAMTAEIPLDLGRRMRRRFRELVPDGVVFGEVVPQHFWRWQQEKVVDAGTDFDFHAIVTDLVLGRRTPESAFAELARTELLRGGDPRRDAVRFVSTHDPPPLAALALAHDAVQRVPLAYVLLLTLPGIPLLLDAEELGLRSEGDGDPIPKGTMRALLHLRRATPELAGGSFTLLHVDDAVVVYRRGLVDVALNFADEARTVVIEDDEHPRLDPIAAVAGAAAHEQELVLPPCSALVARRSVVHAPSRRNLALRDDDLRLASWLAAARPSRFGFSVTERTKAGTARTMTRAVIDALAPDLALGTYFAFAHGGEALTAPIFFDLLEAIRSARGAEPYDAHLRTNGLLLDPRTAARLVDLGVRSIAISLDGAIRFEDVVDNVRRVATWRAETKTDLRLGLSSVVLAQNVGELRGIVELAADLGLDWVKLAAGVVPDGMAAAVSDAIVHGRARGLVMVDHTIDRAVWRCRLDDDTRAFLEADEFANRAEIHPCRTPWETAWIEPNGDVRVRDVFGPIAGNVVERPLAELWNAPPAASERVRAARTRLCGTGPVVCLEPPPSSLP